MAGTRKLMMLTPLPSLPSHQEGVHELVMPSVNQYHTILHYSLQMGSEF